MKTITKFLVIGTITMVSVMNLRINFQRTESGNINLSSLSIASTSAYSEDSGGGGTWYPYCRCHTSNMTCKEGSAVSFRALCNCFYTTACRD